MTRVRLAAVSGALTAALLGVFGGAPPAREAAAAPLSAAAAGPRQKPRPVLPNGSAPAPGQPAPAGGAGARPALPAAAQPTPSDASGRPLDQPVNDVVARGREIASYAEAVAKTREAFHSHDVDMGQSSRVVVVDRGGTWHAVFVKREVVGADTRGWVAVADIGFVPQAGVVSTFDPFVPPKTPAPDAQVRLRALEVAHDAARAYESKAPPPYDEMVFKEKNGAFTVYLSTRSAGKGTVTFGADLMATISGDGAQVADIRPLHDEPTVIPVPAKAGAAPTLHTHGPGDLPSPTDVALVIEHPPLAPHLVLTPRWIFRIEADGGLTWLGPNQPPAAPAGGR